MMSKQAIMRPGACEALPKTVKTAWHQTARPVQRRPQAVVSSRDVRTNAYEDYDGGSRYNRGPRGRQGGGDQNRYQQRGSRSRQFDDGDNDDWSALSGESYEEQISFSENGEPSTTGGFVEQQQQRPGRGYGRGRGGYGGGGRGYGRGGGGGQRRYGGDQWGDAEQQQFGERGSGEQWQQGEGGQGRRYQDGGGRGRGRGSYGGGRGRGGYAGADRGEGTSSAEGGDERRMYRGPREAMSPEALAARLANNDAVRTAEDWRAVAAVLEARGSSLDGENISQMLFKICRQNKPTSPAEATEFETLVASLYGWVSVLAPTMRTKAVASTLYAVARLELFNAELVMALATRAQQLLGNFTTWEYSNMAWAFSRMNFTPGDEWLQQYTYWTERKLPEFKAMELANTITALSRLGYVPPASWLDAFAAAVGRQPNGFNTLEAINTLFGLASVGYNGGADPGSWLGPLLEANSSSGSGAAAEAEASGSDGYSWRQAGSQGVSPAAMETMKINDLTRMTWALTQFNWQPPAAWLEATCRSFVRQLRYTKPSDLATISYSLAYLRATPSADDLKILAGLLPRSWQNLSGDELANVAMSLALWQYRPPTDRWLDELVVACRDKLGDCSADGLSKVVSALPMLGSGYRLNQVVAQAQAKLDDAAQQQQQQQQEEAGVESPDAAMTPV